LVYTLYALLRKEKKKRKVYAAVAGAAICGCCFAGVAARLSVWEYLFDDSQL